MISKRDAKNIASVGVFHLACMKNDFERNNNEKVSFFRPSVMYVIDQVDLSYNISKTHRVGHESFSRLSDVYIIDQEIPNYEISWGTELGMIHEREAKQSCSFGVFHIACMKSYFGGNINEKMFSFWTS